MSKHARTILTLLVIAFLAFYAWRYGQDGEHPGNYSGQSPANPPNYQKEPACPGTALASWYTAKHLSEHPDERPSERPGRSGKQTLVYGQGEVVKVLPDDTKGARHQRFLLKVAPELVVLVAHNTDIAPKVDGLAAGDRLSFCGEYIWNEKGGILHWTHHDPASRQTGGWLRLGNTLYR